MPPKASDPHWADIFEAGMKDALDGKPATTRGGHYWDGYTYGLAVLEKERERKATEEAQLGMAIPTAWKFWSMHCELKNKTIKAVKKDRECAWCAEPINKGESAQYRVYIYEGFRTDWMHPECASAMNRTEEDLSEGFMPGDFPRGNSISWDELREMRREKPLWR